MTTKRLGLAAPLALAAALTLAAPAGAAGLPTDLWQRAWGWLAGLRAEVGELVNVWAGQGVNIDPNSAPARAGGKSGLANVWAGQGANIDPDGAPIPRSASGNGGAPSPWSESSGRVEPRY